MLGVQSVCNQLFLGLHNRLISPPLLANPFLDVAHERCHHIELIRVAIVAFIPVAPDESRQISQVIPRDLADLLPGFGLKVGVERNIAEDEHPHMLLAHRDVNVLHVPLILRDQASSTNVESGLFPDFTDSAVEVLLVLVDLATWERPRRAFLPPLHKHHPLHTLVEQDGTTHRHAHFVCQELLVCRKMLLASEAAQERTVLEKLQAELPQVHAGQRPPYRRGQRPNEIFVVPLRLFDLETQARDAFEFGFG
jgi:hypothetical protein